MIRIANGIYKMTFGTPEKFTPVSVLGTDPDNRGLSVLPDNKPPFCEDDIVFSRRKGAITLEIPLDPSEDVYGLGLMLKSFRQTGLKKKLRSNSDPTADTGDTHAPVPFYATTKGYGVLIDTARYLTFYCGNVKKKRPGAEKQVSAGTDRGHWWIKSGTGNMFVDIPSADGVDIYVFSGDSIKDAVARYNLFSGGGVFPPIWGLGVLYRAYMPGDAEHILGLAKELRDEKIPCDIFGLEPGWHTHAYSCTYDWNREKFPDPEGMLKKLHGMGYHVNLWEHAYVHPTSPIYNDMKDCSGDCFVWDGLVPDFATDKAKKVFSDRHKMLKEQGISGFKLDEADNSDFTANWGFPDFAAFPSGMDGEQMHTLIGALYQKTMLRPYEDSGERTFGQCRQSTALASSFPYVLYSDLYDHTDFVRGMASAAFSGIMWTPEVRFAESTEELLRRIEAAVVSPQTVLNCYQVPSPPWKQWDYEKNVRGVFLPDADIVTDAVRKILRFRMSLIPYLYTAFYRYYSEGVPVVRAPIMDYPGIPELKDVYDSYMIGDGLLAAPVIFGQGNRKTVYLPDGVWYDFNTGERICGGRYISEDIPLDVIPLFVKEGTLLPLAEPLEHIPENAVFDVTLKAYGEGECSCTLICDDGHTNAYRAGDISEATLTVRGENVTSDRDHPGYRICAVERIK